MNCNNMCIPFSEITSWFFAEYIFTSLDITPFFYTDVYTRLHFPTQYSHTFGNCTEFLSICMRL